MKMEFRSGDVKDFLLDTNHFLSNTLKNEHLSSKAKAELDALLRRLSCLLEPADPYIDMSGSTKCLPAAEYVGVDSNRDKGIESKLYEEFPDNQVPENSFSQDCRPNISIEHIIVPATKIRTVAQKFGSLWRKERFMGLFVERSIRCYVGLIGHYLYVYNSEKDMKPATYINIQGFEARPSIAYFPRDSKKREFSFEIVCPGKKSHQFLANSLQEMELWIHCINVSGMQSNDVDEHGDKLKKLPAKYKQNSVPSSLSIKCVEEYDDIQGRSDCDLNQKIEEYSDEIYYNIKDINIVSEQDVSSIEKDLGDSECTSDQELIYDDISPSRPSLYYNVNEQRMVKEINTYCYDDEDIYDDIGVLETLVSRNCDIDPSSRSNVTKKDNINNIGKNSKINEVICDDSEVLPRKHCTSDNLYEPVENPRDE